MDKVTAHMSWELTRPSFYEQVCLEHSAGVAAKACVGAGYGEKDGAGGAGSKRMYSLYHKKWIDRVESANPLFFTSGAVRFRNIRATNIGTHLTKFMNAQASYPISVSI